MLVEIGDKIISADLFKKKFACDLVACKGACCVEGDAGAPLIAEEVAAISSQLDEIRPFMNKEGFFMGREYKAKNMGGKGSWEIGDRK